MATCNLRELINDHKVKEVTSQWKDVGVELDIPTSKLNEIETDRSFVNDRKREMFEYWLKNTQNATFEDVHQAIQVVFKRNEREQNRLKAEKEGEETEEAVEKLETFVKTFKRRNDKLAIDNANCKGELKREKEWMHAAKSKGDSSEEWQNKEDVATKRDIENALRSTKLKGNQFAKDYLRRNYNQQADDLTEAEIEGYLRQALIDIESGQSRSLKDHYKQAKKHFKRQTLLTKEINELQRIIAERLKSYENIGKRLVQIGVGVEAEILVRLNEQKQIVESIKQESDTMYEECKEVYEFTREKVQDYQSELKVLMNSFGENILKLDDILTEISKSMEVTWETIKGAAIGATVGTIVFPIVGTVIGALVGGASGYIYGAVNVAKAQMEYERLSRSQTNFKENLERVRYERDDLQFLLRD